MSGICDTCRRKPCPAEGEGLRRCDFHEGGETRYERLFGTPERAARTLRGETPMCDTCELNGKPCCEKGYYGCAQLNDYDALLEWLRGDTE